MKMKPQIWQRCAFGGGLYSTPKTWLSKVTPWHGCHSVASTFSRRSVLEEHNRKHDCSIYNHLFVVGRSFTVVGKAEFPATVTAEGGRKSLKRSASCFPCGKHFPHNALWKLLGLGVISYWHTNVFRADGGVCYLEARSPPSGAFYALLWIHRHREHQGWRRCEARGEERTRMDLSASFSPSSCSPVADNSSSFRHNRRITMRWVWSLSNCWECRC